MKRTIQSVDSPCYWSDPATGEVGFLSPQKALVQKDTENSVETYLVEQVEKHGGRCPKLVDMGRRGFPDRSPMWEEAVIHFVETKCPGGSVKPWQKRDHQDLRDMGFLVFVLWTKEQVDEYIAEFAPARWK